MPRLSVYLTVSDPQAALDFYMKAFGFEKGDNLIPGPDGKLMHAEAKFQEAVIMFGPECEESKLGRTPANSGEPSPVGMYIYCDDVDAMYQQAASAGATSVEAPADMFWGDRMAVLKDPDGHQWTFATNVADFDPSKLPGAAG
jgi:uncharacterized glyoxalase superfamily protein PhnB